MCLRHYHYMQIKFDREVLDHRGVLETHGIERAHRVYHRSAFFIPP